MNTYRFPIFPRLAAPTSVRAMMLDVIVALIPALGMSVYLFGFQVLWLALCSMGFCVLFQWLYCLIFRREKSYLDPSPWVSGLLLAFCYPADIPLWAIPAGSLFAIVVVKELFGGLGCNFLNPALAGWLFLSSSPFLTTQYITPLPMTTTVDALSSATPLSYLHQGVLSPHTLGELFLGFHGGSMGEVSSLMLLLGGFYLLIRRVISPTIPLSFLGTVAILAYLFPQNGQDPTQWMLQQLLSGGLILGAFFMATDPVTSPVTLRGQLLFGVGCGALTLFLRYFGSYPEGVAFGILTMNSLVWLCDMLGMPRYFAQKHFSGTEKILTLLSKQLQSIQFIRPKFPPVKTLFTKEFWQAGKEVGKKIFSRPSGTVPGERYLDRLPSAVANILSYSMVLAVTLLGIYLCSLATSLKTHQNEDQRTLALLATAMPQATFLSETPYQGSGFNTLYLAYQGHNEVGYCVELSTAGFHGEIQMLVGVDMEGAVTGVAILSHSETPKLGEQALTPEALSKYVGKSGTLSLSGSNRIDAISGATVTQDAIVLGVNYALEIVQLIDQVGALSQLDGVS